MFSILTTLYNFILVDETAHRNMNAFLSALSRYRKITNSNLVGFLTSSNFSPETLKNQRCLVRNTSNGNESRNASGTNELPTSADVIVIGGGAVGTSTAFHLAKRGVDVVLVERHK